MPSFTRFRLSALGGLLALTVSVALPLAAHASPMQPSGPNPKAPAGPAPSPPPAEAATARPSTSTPGPSPAATATPATASVQPAAAPAGPAGITVSSWGFSQTSPKDTGPSPQTATVGRPLYVWMVLDGGEAAVDQLKNGSQVSIQVHWTNDNAASKAPALTSNLTVGRPDIAATLAGQVAKTGHFQWHSWTRKDVLSPGHWTVSLTDPSGQPISCGQGPCQLSINVS